jgi:hypothetical protein
MPPRFAYWTILIDNKPTAFRAAKREELQPTFAQLKRTNADVTMKWFARGRLWDDPEQAQWAGRNANRPQEKRGRDWRPGGSHRDPRAQFDRRQSKHADHQPRPDRDPSAPPRDLSRRPPPRDPSRRPPPRASSARQPPHSDGGNRRPPAYKPPRAPWQRDQKPAGARPREDRPRKHDIKGGSQERRPAGHGAPPAWKAKHHPHGGSHRPWKPGAPPGDRHRRRRHDDDSGKDDK